MFDPLIFNHKFTVCHGLQMLLLCLQVERTSELGRKEATTEEVDYVNTELKKLYKLSNSMYILS